MLKLIIPAAIAVVGIISYRVWLYYHDRKEIRRCIRKLSEKWEKEDVTTEYSDKKYKPIWRKQVS
jgi:hypothetical protein